MRIIHLLVVGMLIFAAAYVYRIKMESTSRVERVQRLNAEIREQRDAIAVLRAEWARLDAPLRLQGLAERHLALKPLNATQYDSLKNLPDRPDDPGDRFRRCDGFGAHAGGSAMIDRTRGTVRPAEPWRQRLIRSLLYGRNVDRAVKARVRVGFAMVAFLAIYAVIGGRLIMFAVGG